MTNVRISVLEHVLSYLIKLVSLPLKIGSSNPQEIEFKTALSIVPYFYGYNKQTISALFKQSWVETGNFKSLLFVEFNNAFGMKVPSKRRSLRNGEYDVVGKGTFSTYSNLTFGLIDRILLDKYNKVQTNTSFDSYLDQVINQFNYLPLDERANYFENIYENAPVFNFFFKAFVSALFTLFGLYYITNRLFN
tara:strand:+ start:45 stop:620 length:576 start_codon:yes stop_codon:yes gene_type:complete